MVFTPIFRLGWIGLALSACEANHRTMQLSPGNVELLVKFQDTMAEADRIRFEKTHGLTRLRGFADGQTFLYQASTSDGRDPIPILQAQPGIVFVETNQTYQAMRPAPAP